MHGVFIFDVLIFQTLDLKRFDSATSVNAERRYSRAKEGNADTGALPYPKVTRHFLPRPNQESNIYVMRGGGGGDSIA